MCQVKMWWPNGYGQPVLYDAAVIFSDSRGEMDRHSIKIGFRTVELVQQPVSTNHQLGQSHSVNGQTQGRSTCVAIGKFWTSRGWTSHNADICEASDQPLTLTVVCLCCLRLFKSYCPHVTQLCASCKLHAHCTVQQVYNVSWVGRSAELCWSNAIKSCHYD